MSVDHLPRLLVRQLATPLTNRYEVVVPAPEGSPARSLAFAEQKRLALKEHLVFWADRERDRVVLEVRARRRLEVSSGYDITDEHGERLGFLRREFGASLLRTTFRLQGEGFEGLGQERSGPAALARRFAAVHFLPIHFDFADRSGRPLVSVTRAARVRDIYTVDVPDPRVDWRVAAAVGVGMDALMGR